MDILHRETEVLTVERITLQMPDGLIVRVLEYTDSNGKVVDSIVRDKHGYELDDLNLTDQIWEFLDAHYAQENEGPEYDSAGFTYEDRVVDGQYRTTNNLPAENAENTNLENV